MKTGYHCWRGIDWREVELIDGADGSDVKVYFLDDREAVTISHYPGEDTYQRCRAELFHGQRWARLYGQEG